MSGAEKLPTSRAPMQAPDVVRELCDSLEAATRGDLSHAGSKIRRAVTLGAKLLSTGAIDSRGASLIYGAAARAEKALRAMQPGVQVLVTAQEFVESQRRIDPSRSVALPPDRLQSVEDQRFDARRELLAGDERRGFERKPHTEYCGQEFYANRTTPGVPSEPAKR